MTPLIAAAQEGTAASMRSPQLKTEAERCRMTMQRLLKLTCMAKRIRAERLIRSPSTDPRPSSFCRPSCTSNRVFVLPGFVCAASSCTENSQRRPCTWAALRFRPCLAPVIDRLMPFARQSGSLSTVSFGNCQRDRSTIPLILAVKHSSSLSVTTMHRPRLPTSEPAAYGDLKRGQLTSE